jgi:hypothetical protein
MDRRLQLRYVQLVKAHMGSSTHAACGPAILPELATSAAATQAAWRFLNNERVTLPALGEPLRQAGRTGCEQSPSEFVLLAHDWCKLDYGTHTSKEDKRVLTHQHDIGYELSTALLVDAHSGAPLAPMQLHLKTADTLYSTSTDPPDVDEHRLDQVLPTMNAVAEWQLPRRVVHVIDREADALGRFREWDKAEHLFLVRADDRRVLWNDESWLLSEIVEHFNQEGLFADVREVSFQGKTARQEVAETEIVLHRKHKRGKQSGIAGRRLMLRLVMARVVDDQGGILAEWLLLTNVEQQAADAALIALWYYWRWRIETFFKLLKSAGHEVEYWQQESGAAIMRRLLVAAMACVVVWNLQWQTTPEAQEVQRVLVRLSGRRMKRNVICTAPALLAGYMVLLSIADLLEHTDFDLKKLKALAAQALPFVDSS